MTQSEISFENNYFIKQSGEKSTNNIANHKKYTTDHFDEINNFPPEKADLS